MLLLGAIGAADAQSGHEHAAASAAAPQSTGQRWATDAPLRSGMHAVRGAVADLAHYERGHMGPEQAAQIATQIEDSIHGIIANCKLAPDADAALHRIIGPLLQQAGALKADPGNLEPIPKMRAALADYAREFDDPDFAAPAP